MVPARRRPRQTEQGNLRPGGRAACRNRAKLAVVTSPTRAPVQAVCLDLMGTVLHDPYLEAIRAGTGGSVEAFHRDSDWVRSGTWHAFERGEIDEATFEARLAAATPDGVDVAAFTAARHAGYAYLPGMQALVAELAARLPVWIASNYPLWIDDLLGRFGLADLVAGVVVSCRVGVRKPDPGFYEAMVQAVGVPAESCLFVDDRPVNCGAAEAAGLRAQVFTGAAGLRERLAAEGVVLAGVDVA